MRQDRDYEDRLRWAAQDRRKAERLAEWRNGRADGGVPAKPDLSRMTIERVELYHDVFADTDVHGRLHSLDDLSVLFKAAFGRKPNGYETDWDVVAKVEVRMQLVGDPRHSWHDWTKVELTESERIRLECLIVATFAERNRERKASEEKKRSSASRVACSRAPLSTGPLNKPGSPHLDTSNDEYWSMEAVQERADEKALLREGRERYGDDWYLGKYVN